MSSSLRNDLRRRLGRGWETPLTILCCRGDLRPDCDWTWRGLDWKLWLRLGLLCLWYGGQTRSCCGEYCRGQAMAHCSDICLVVWLREKLALRLWLGGECSRGGQELL